MLSLPVQTYLMILVGLVTRDQLEVIQYLQAENAVLREQLDAALHGKRPRFTQRQRRRLAEFGQSCHGLDTSDQRIAQTRSGCRRRKCRSKARPRPAPAFGVCTMPRSEFVRIHWHALASCDFFSVEVITLRGYVRFQVLFVMRLATREVQIAGISPDIDGAWMQQVARNLTDSFDGFLLGMNHLIHDRDPLFTKAFTELLDDSGVTCKKLPAKSPNLNAYAERFVRTARETLSQHIFLGERHLRYVLSETMAHNHAERHHQGLGGRLIRPLVSNDNANTDGQIQCRERLGGLLKFYSRRAV